MAGIYIHIPFCKKACHYCDFHFSTSLKYTDDMVEAICTELILKKSRITGEIGSVYFGGGTPSLLSDRALHKIFNTLQKHYNLVPEAEITIEANPDDLTADKVRQFSSLPVNRFSIGVQSFFEEDLVWMNRAHTATEAESAIKRAQDAGFENLTIDLIYGFPLLTDKKWGNNVAMALALQVPHISAYSMTVEDRTALAHAIKTGRQSKLSDAQSARQFTSLLDTLTENGFDHYEISNFAKPGKYAVHNTNYWKGIAYLGIGPSAHGFEKTTRYANVANNNQYMQHILGGNLAETEELLSLEDRYNEYVMTSLRTMWGINIPWVETEFGGDFLKAMHTEAEQFIKDGKLLYTPTSLTLSKEGKLYADQIAANLFVINAAH